MTATGSRHGRTRRRTLVAAIALVLVTSVVHAIWVVGDATAVHDREVAAELRRNADAQAAQLDALLTQWANLLGSIRALDQIDEVSFETFVDEGLADRDPLGVPTGTYGGMTSVIWIEADEDAYVARYGRPDPLLGLVEGIDLAELPERRVALESARDTGQATTTDFFVPATDVGLPPEQQSQLASIYVPVYDDGGVPESVEARREALLGWAITGFRADALLDQIATDSRLATTLLADGEPVWNSRSGASVTNSTGTSASADATALSSDWSVEVAPLVPIRPRGGLSAYPLLEGFVVLAAGVGLALGLWRIGTSREAALQVADRRRLEAAAIRTARQNMADRLSIGLIDVDRHGIVRFVNARGLILLGAERGEVVGSKLDDILSEVFAQDLAVTFASAVEDGDGETASLHPTTSGRHVRLTCAANHSGGMLATIEDVTEIQELNNSLDAVVRERDHGHRLMATLSHEIRTPLAGIVGLARTLIDDGLQDRSAAERIERIERSGADLLRIADDALTVAVADNSTLPLRPTTVDLRRHVGEVLDDVRSRSSSDVEVRLMITGHVGSVVIDSARVRQIVGNLVENALRHTSAGHVEVAVEVQGSTCSITVSDTGEGIPSGKLARIFEPFSQVDESATRVGGAGLGLSVVRKVVDAMGGRVTATSVVGLGSRFRVELPVRTAAASESATDLGTDSTPRALLVEDDDTSALVTTAALERLGFEVERLADGRSGVNAVAAGCPHDLVLVDLHLPRTDGFGVISALARRPGQLVAAVTASSHPGDLERCHLLGVDAVFQKPVASEQLADLLEHAEAIGDEARPADPIDTDQLRRLVDLGVHSEVFDLLDAQIPQTRHELLVGDADQVRLALHTMAGSMRVLGATAARHRLSHAEQHLRDGGDLGAVRGEAEDLIRHVIGAVERAEEMVSRLG